MLAETTKVMRDRIKTILELRRDTVLVTVFFTVGELCSNSKEYSILNTQLVVKLPRKARTSNTSKLPVPETDTGR
jgi:hypothetical protein